MNRRALAVLAAVPLVVVLASCDGAAKPAGPSTQAQSQSDASTTKGRVSLTPEQAALIVGKIDALAARVQALETNGSLSHGEVQRLIAQLDIARRALGGSGASALVATTAAQQPVLADIGKALNALLKFLENVLDLTTDLPNQVVDPIVSGVIDLLTGLISLLTGA
ncbi:MAG TPA: hypothetical protein VHM67_14300 [Gemmatimonadaceae bacterium]|nr:hypothetical protein [Gemmatimonadaceae bacterium]